MFGSLSFCCPITGACHLHAVCVHVWGIFPAVKLESLDIIAFLMQVSIFIMVYLQQDVQGWLQPYMLAGAIAKEAGGRVLHGPVSFGACSECTTPGQHVHPIPSLLFSLHLLTTPPPPPPRGKFQFSFCLYMGSWLQAVYLHAYTTATKS